MPTSLIIALVVLGLMVIVRISYNWGKGESWSPPPEPKIKTLGLSEVETIIEDPEEPMTTQIAKVIKICTSVVGFKFTLNEDITAEQSRNLSKIQENVRHIETWTQNISEAIEFNKATEGRNEQLGAIASSFGLGVATSEEA